MCWWSRAAWSRCPAGSTSAGTSDSLWGPPSPACASRCCWPWRAATRPPPGWTRRSRSCTTWRSGRSPRVPAGGAPGLRAAGVGGGLGEDSRGPLPDQAFHPGRLRQGREGEAMTANEVAPRHRTCPLCEAMCGLTLEVSGDRVLAVRGDPDDAFAETVKRLADIRRAHGDDAVAFYVGNPALHSYSATLAALAFARALNTPECVPHGVGGPPTAHVRRLPQLREPGPAPRAGCGSHPIPAHLRGQSGSVEREPHVRAQHGPPPQGPAVAEGPAGRGRSAADQNRRLGRHPPPHPPGD